MCGLLGKPDKCPGRTNQRNTRSTRIRAGIIELVIAAKEAESQTQFAQVMNQFEGITNIGLLIFQVARDQIADARIRYARN